MIGSNLLKGVLGLLVLLLSACSTPSTVFIPDDDIVDQKRIETTDVAHLPPPVTRIVTGDTLRIVRDAQSPAQRDEMTLFFIKPDGSFAYPFVGTIRAVGRTPEEIAEIITEKLTPIYRQPQVTVNIATAPGNRVFVGGSVRNPSAYDLTATASIGQAIISAGGILPTGDSKRVALLRIDTEGYYQIYFIDFSQFLKPENRKAVMLQRGDVIYVPQSGIGNAIEAVNLYMNQLIPFNKAIGLGFNYDLNATRTNKVDIYNH